MQPIPDTAVLDCPRLANVEGRLFCRDTRVKDPWILSTLCGRCVHREEEELALRTTPDHAPPPRGTGDRIARAINAVFPHPPCGGCTGRQEGINELEQHLKEMVFGKTDTRPAVGFLCPSLPLGGFGRVLADLMSAATRIRFGGVALRGHDRPFEPFAVEIRKHCKIHQRYWQGDAQRVIDNSDLVVVWGFVDESAYAGLEFQGKPVVLQSHGPGDFSRALYVAARNVATRFMAVSEAARSAFPLEMWPEVRIVPNGIDPLRVVPVVSRDQMRRHWGFGGARESDRYKIVGYLGRIAGDKRPLAAAEAVGVLQGDWRAIMLGSGSNPEFWSNRCREFADGRAKILPPVNHIGDALDAIDVWINASPAEGACLGLIESLLAGRPSVSTVTGALPEYERAAGFPLCEHLPDNPTADELARAVRAAYSDDGWLRAERASEWAKHHLTAAKMAEAFEDFILEIVGATL